MQAFGKYKQSLESQTVSSLINIGALIITYTSFGVPSIHMFIV